jgi:hypothetical protein
VLLDGNGNVSEAARRLGILRQSLQRRLRKHAPPERSHATIEKYGAITVVGTAGAAAGRPLTSPDGTRVIMAGVDSTAWVWDLGPADARRPWSAPDAGSRRRQ